MRFFYGRAFIADWQNQETVFLQSSAVRYRPTAPSLKQTAPAPTNLRYQERKAPQL